MLQGAVAQLGERLVCNQEATGSIPVSSTNSFDRLMRMEWMEGLGPILDVIAVILAVAFACWLAFRKEPSEKK